MKPRTIGPHRVPSSILLLQRHPNAEFAQDMWDLPVGRSEPGEPVPRAAVRELYEETGLTVDPRSRSRALTPKDDPGSVTVPWRPGP